MRWLGLAVCSALVPSACLADGTAEAAITWGGRTTFLTADNSASALPMVVRDGNMLHLTFAQLHLPFPMPPFLHVALLDTPDGWQARDITWDAPGENIAFSPSALRLEAGDTGMTLTGEALLAGPLGVDLTGVEIEVQVNLAGE